MTAQQYSQITPSSTELYMVTDEAITSSDVTTALGYTPTSPANVDGQPVQITPVAGSISTAIGGYVHDLSSNDLNVLPNDNNKYMVTCTIAMNSNSDTFVYVGTSANPYTNDTYVGWVRASSNGRICVNTFEVPVDTDRKIYFQRINATGTNPSSCTYTSYRRIGTNT